MSAFLNAALAWASAHGHELFDPQNGTLLKRLSQIPWLKAAPRGKTLATQLKNLVKDRLRAEGFVFHKPRIIERQVDVLRQGFEFLPPRGGGQAVNVFWRLDLGKDFVPTGFMEPVSLVERESRQAIASLARRETDVVAALRRGRATPPAATWPRRSRSTKLTGGITSVVRLKQLRPQGAPRIGKEGDIFLQNVADVLDFGLPYLDRFASAQRLIEAVDAGELDVGEAFGTSPGWQQYQHGLCLAHVGRTAEAIPVLQDLIDNHSLHHLQLHAIRMREEGKPHFAERAEAEFEALVRGGASWLQKERREHAESLIAEWSKG